MEKPEQTPEQQGQPIHIDLLPTPDRSSVTILFRSNAPIPMATLVNTVKKFSEELEKKHAYAQEQAKKILTKGAGLVDATGKPVSS